MTAWAPVATTLAWGSIILQLAFPFMLLRRPTRIFALVGILGFHIGIGVLMGLPWFSLTMIAVDAIFIRDATWRRMHVTVVSAWREARSGEPGTERGALDEEAEPVGAGKRPG